MAIRRVFKSLFQITLLLYFVGAPLQLFSNSLAKITLPEKPTTTPESKDAPLEVSGKIDVKPTTRDDEIRERLQKILKATGWFDNTSVHVVDGVVFLNGSTKMQENKTWAGNLAKNTQGATAVVNKIIISKPPIWSFGLIFGKLREEFRRVIWALPSILAGIIILFIAYVIARLITPIVRKMLHKKFTHLILADVIAKSIGCLIFLIGIYVVFELANLTNIAMTVVGGTGLIGIVLGIAFRDITENFLASIFLSIQNPFRNGDLIEINNNLGYVQRLTMRVTVLMDMNGSHIQIPNSTVYKSEIKNYTSNPNRRDSFLVGISYDTSISTAQEAALKVLKDHEAVLNDPEPLVLVSSMDSSSINLQIYFWVDGTKYSILKVRSSLIRLVKGAFHEKHITIPDSSRERLFPKGISVELIKREGQVAAQDMNLPKTPPVHKELKTVATKAESGLASEAKEIKDLASQSQMPEKGKDLLSKSTRKQDHESVEKKDEIDNSRDQQNK